MTKMYHTFNGLLFIDMYEMIAEMGNENAKHRLNWISYRGIVCVVCCIVCVRVCVCVSTQSQIFVEFLYRDRGGSMGRILHSSH